LLQFITLICISLMMVPTNCVIPFTLRHFSTLTARGDLASKNGVIQISPVTGFNVNAGTERKGWPAWFGGIQVTEVPGPEVAGLTRL
jgi:hypothetical protein